MRAILFKLIENFNISVFILYNIKYEIIFCWLDFFFFFFLIVANVVKCKEEVHQGPQVVAA